MNKKIKEVIEILEKYFNYSEKTTLKKPDAFKILISCLLSLRARDENTEKVSRELFKYIKKPEDLVKINIKKLEKIIYSSGHYHKKARVLKLVSKELIKRFQGRVPDTRKDLLSIKHIGPKTANIVLNFAYGQCVIPVDTHCHRVPNRLGWIKTKTAEKSEIELNKIIDDKYKCEFNGIFVLFGREICTPLSPKCSICPVLELCLRINVVRSR